MFEWLKSLFLGTEGSGEGRGEEVSYKGYLIRPNPSKIARVYGPREQVAARQGKWNLQVFIRKETDGGSAQTGMILSSSTVMSSPS